MQRSRTPARPRGGRRPSRAEAKQMLDFAGKRWWYLAVSLVLFVAAAILLAIPPHLVAGIEFTSGSTFTLQFANNVSQTDLRNELQAEGYDDTRVQGAGTNRYLVRTRE